MKTASDGISDEELWRKLEELVPLDIGIIIMNKTIFHAVRDLCKEQYERGYKAGKIDGGFPYFIGEKK